MRRVSGVDVAHKREVGVRGEQLDGPVLGEELEQLPADGEWCLERLHLALWRHPRQRRRQLLKRAS